MLKNKINIILADKFKTDEKLLREILERLIKAEKIKKRVVVSLVVVGNKTIKEINKMFRGKNRATSILSFPLLSSSKFVTPEEELFLGDIIINIEKIKKEKKDFKAEIKKNLAHSFLHLLSYTHDSQRNEKIMKKEEEKLIGVLNDI